MFTPWGRDDTSQQSRDSQNAGVMDGLCATFLPTWGPAKAHAAGDQLRNLRDISPFSEFQWSLPSCIFKLQSAGGLFFVEAVQTLDAAKVRVRDLARCGPASLSSMITGLGRQRFKKKAN